MIMIAPCSGGHNTLTDPCVWRGECWLVDLVARCPVSPCTWAAHGLKIALRHWFLFLCLGYARRPPIAGAHEAKSWEVDLGGKWASFSAEENNELNVAVAAGKGVVKLHSRGFVYTVDLRVSGCQRQALIAALQAENHLVRHV